MSEDQNDLPADTELGKKWRLVKSLVPNATKEICDVCGDIVDLLRGKRCCDGETYNEGTEG